MWQLPSAALFAYLFTHRFQRATGFPASREPYLLWTVQHKTWYLPINYVVWMFPSCITHIECAAFLLVIIQEDSLLAVLVLEVAAINVGKGLLINLRRYAASFSMMIGDLKQWLVTHQILPRLAHQRAEQEYTPFSMRQ